MADLRRHLVETRIAGAVATSRQGNLRNIGRMLADAPEYWFGLRRSRDWTHDEVVEVMARRCGISADPEHLEGDDTIDPDLTVAALTRHRERLAQAAARRERVSDTARSTLSDGSPPPPSHGTYDGFLPSVSEVGANSSPFSCARSRQSTGVAPSTSAPVTSASRWVQARGTTCTGS